MLTVVLPQLPTTDPWLSSQPLPVFPSQEEKPVLQERKRQLPVEQLSLAPGRLQTVPQPPQLVRVFRRLSHPLAPLPSQLPKPLLQVPRRQLPVLQLSLAFARLQVFPQPPQFVRVFKRASQPLPAVPSQSSKPLLQRLTPQLPPGQVPVPLAMLQLRPQPPQLDVVAREVSQPFAPMPSQSP